MQLFAQRGPATRPTATVSATVDDVETIALAALEAGDKRAALTALMNGYGDAIFRHCLAFLRDRALAQDVQQTVFVQVWRDIDRFEGRSKLRTWIYRIARNRCLDAAKIRRRRRARITLVEETPEGVDGQPSAEDALVRSSLEGPLAAALATLKPKIRSAILLRFQDDMSYAEIARITGERAGTLQMRVVRAMPKLRRILEEKGVVA